MSSIFPMTTACAPEEAAGISIQQHVALAPEAALAFEIYKQQLNSSLLNLPAHLRQELAKRSLEAAKEFIQIMHDNSQTIFPVLEQ